MRKKSILMVCITALVALAMFVGCDNAPVYPSFVVGGSVDQTGDFLIGQKFDPSKFSVSVRYSDGSTKTLKDTSIVTLQGDGDTVSTNSVVEARLGLDYDNVEYVQTAGVSAYAISALEVTGPETVTADTDETAFTVTAKYLKNGAEMTMVLNSQEFDVTGITGSEEDGAPVVVKVTPTLEDNKTITASYNAVFSGKSTVLPEDAVVESISAKFVEDFSVNKLNYGAEAPAIDGSKIEVTAKIAGDTTPYDVASSDVEFTWVDAQGLPLIDYNFIDNNVSTLYVKASFDGCEAVTGAVDVFPVTVSWQNAGFKAPENIYAGDELPAVEGIRYTWTANGKSGIIPAEDVELVYAYATSAEGKIDGSVKVDEKVGLLAGNNLIAYPVYKGQAAAEDGIGIYLGYVEAKKVTVESVEFSMAEDWKAPAKQYYDALPTLTAADAIEKYIVTKSDGTTEEFDGSNATFSAAYYLAEGEPLSDAKATKDGDFDALANVDTILVGVTYGIETYYSDPIPLEKAVFDTLSATANEDGTDMVGDKVNVVVVASNDEGDVDKNFTDYSVLDASGAPCEIVLEAGAADVEYTIYANSDVDVSTTVTVYAGKGYIAPKGDTVLLKRNATEMSEKVGATINTTLVEKYFEIDTNSYDTIDGEGEETAPAIIGINLPAARTLVTGDNIIPVEIQYTGSTGKTVTDTVEVTIVGTAFVVGDPDFTLLYENEPVEKLVDGRLYYIDRFSVDTDSYTATGTPTISVGDTVKNQFGASFTSTFTADNDFDYTFTVSYTDANLSAQTKSVILDTVVASN